MTVQTWEVTCVKCTKLRWPYMAEKPEPYTCMRCRSGVNEGKRESGRRGAASTNARRRHQDGPNGSAHSIRQGEDT